MAKPNPTVDVPSREEFDALTARVDALDAEVKALDGRVDALEGGAPPDPLPEPPDPAPGEGVQAKRIHELIELFGVNTFSSMDENNRWGSWPADYRPDSVIAGLNWIAGDSDFRLRIREYHYAGYESWQRPWFHEIVGALPGTLCTICPGANAGAADVDTMMSLAKDPACGIMWVEGCNEPNLDFGSGTETPEFTLETQQAVWRARGGLTVYGPSVVAGMPHPEGWITGYLGDTLPAINAASHYGNGHYYPPGCPDLPNSGTSVGEYTGGLWTAYAQHPIGFTEWHPTLFAAGTMAVEANIAGLAGRLKGRAPPIPTFRASQPEREGYYTLLALLRASKCTMTGMWWYALFDYGSTYECGLYPVRGADNPRSSAVALRNLCSVCCDSGPRMRDFEPGRLDVTVNGLTPNCDWDLYQASDGRFLLMLWNSQQDQGGAAVPVTVSFAQAPSMVEEYKLCASDEPVHVADNVQDYACNLDASVRVLVVYL